MKRLGKSIHGSKPGLGFVRSNTLKELIDSTIQANIFMIKSKLHNRSKFTGRKQLRFSLLMMQHWGSSQNKKLPQDKDERLAYLVVNKNCKFGKIKEIAFQELSIDDLNKMPERQCLYFLRIFHLQENRTRRRFVLTLRREAEEKNDEIH